MLFTIQGNIRARLMLLSEKVSKRTTIIFDEKDREFLDNLIKENKEQGVKSFISKMFDVYRSMAIYDWKYPGEYYSGISRVAFVHQEVLNGLLELIPKEKRREVGRKVGEALRTSIIASQNIDVKKREKWSDILKHLRILGYGVLLLQDNMIIARNPFISEVEPLQGFLEAIFGVNLKPKTNVSPIIFEIM
jgi:hypothetical protein